MPLKDPVKRKEYYKKWKSANKEKTKITNQRYRDKNKQAINARIKKWKQDHPEATHKSSTLQNWKKMEVKCDDMESLYNLYMSTEFCWHCGCKLTTGKPMTSTTKCLDHCHITGLFRAILCCGCNSKLPKQIKNNININEII